MNNNRGKRSGKRGSDFRPSKGYAKIDTFTVETHGISTTALIETKGGIYNKHYIGEDSAENDGFGRQSLTAKLHLGLFPQETEVEQLSPVKRFQLDKTGKLVETSDPNPKTRVVWKSDKSLLSGSKIDQEQSGFMRVTARSKRRVYVAEPPKSDVLTEGQSAVITYNRPNEVE